jgi:hypothetical protein
MVFIGSNVRLVAYLRHLYQKFQTRDGHLEGDRLGCVINRFHYPTSQVLCFWCHFYPLHCDTLPGDCLCLDCTSNGDYHARASVCTFTQHCSRPAHSGQHGRK